MAYCIPAVQILKLLEHVNRLKILPQTLKYKKE
jgi:hypothetical protein